MSFFVWVFLFLVLSPLLPSSPPPYILSSLSPLPFAITLFFHLGSKSAEKKKFKESQRKLPRKVSFYLWESSGSQTERGINQKNQKNHKKKREQPHTITLTSSNPFQTLPICRSTQQPPSSNRKSGTPVARSGV